VLHNGQLSEPFTTISGVRQGCLLSPLLFLVVLDGILNETFHAKAQGILWKLTQTLEDLENADDACLLSHKYDHMQSKLTCIIYPRKLAQKLTIQRQKRFE
jgi:hypothetical protein